MHGFIAWLTGLPLALLYPVLAAVAAIENVFPPIPADSVVALGSWLAARGDGSAMAAFVFTWAGNVAGATAMYFVGRRHGARWMHERFPRLANARGEARLEAMYGKYGVAALVVSRLIPGVRALVPPCAGALHIPPVQAIGAMAIASAVWYGIISYVAFNADAEWTELTRLIKESGMWVAAGAAVLLAIGLTVWLMRRRRQQAS